MRKILRLGCQSNEEVSSAGEQLISNKTDGYKAIKVGVDSSTFLLCAYRIAKKTHCLLLLKYRYQLIKFFLCSRVPYLWTLRWFLRCPFQYPFSESNKLLLNFMRFTRAGVFDINKNRRDQNL